MLARHHTPSIDFNHFKTCFDPMSTENLARLESFYDINCVFKDPLHTVEGRTALFSYFNSFCSPEIKCRFEFVDEVIDQVAGKACFEWQMHYSHPDIAKGKSISVPGVSILLFDEKINVHQDFYDMGQFLYQHLPLLGWAVKKVNRHILEKSQSAI